MAAFRKSWTSIIKLVLKSIQWPCEHKNTGVFFWHIFTIPNYGISHYEGIEKSLSNTSRNQLVGPFLLTWLAWVRHTLKFKICHMGKHTQASCRQLKAARIWIQECTSPVYVNEAVHHFNTDVIHQLDTNTVCHKECLEFPLCKSWRVLSINLTF